MAQGNYTRDFVITFMGKESERVYMCVCIYMNHFTPETNTTL